MKLDLTVTDKAIPVCDEYDIFYFDDIKVFIMT